jgi:hypothetical protein
MKAAVKEVSVSASIGGKIQIVQYQYTADYHYSNSQKYEVDMTEEEATQFRAEKTRELREELEPIAQDEVDALTALRDKLREEGKSGKG